MIRPRARKIVEAWEDVESSVTAYRRNREAAERDVYADSVEGAFEHLAMLLKRAAEE